MTNQNIVSVPKSELLAAAKNTSINALVLKSSGETLASKGNFGVANSLLILSAEESIKAMLLVAGFIGVKLDFDITPFFKDHGTKHRQAAEMQKFINGFSFFRTHLVEVFRKRESKTDILMNLAISAIFSSIDFERKEADDFGKWWHDANRIKNNGLYVGFHNNTWNLPSQITEIEFSETLKIISPFIEVLSLINEIKVEDYKLFLDSTHPEAINYLPDKKPFFLSMENPDREEDQSTII